MDATIKLIELARAAAAEAAEFQERFAAEDLESRKIVDIMERFLRVQGRVVYGGAAINAHLSAERKFYDPRVNLPDYDFMTPDPLQDCADLIVAFQSEGFTEVEAKFGIHEGTYKIFVNFRAAADITFMPPEIYERIVQDSSTIDGIRYASVNFLRMNLYLELSRPAGDVSRWDKVFRRLLLLNEEHPLRAGRCPPFPHADGPDDKQQKADRSLQLRIVEAGIAAGAVFLSGTALLDSEQPRADEIVLLMSDKPAVLTTTLRNMGLRARPTPAMGELLPARTEFRTTKRRLVAVLFETVACHSYTTLPEPAGYRMASLDLLIQMYYAMYFADLQGYLPIRLLCVIQELIERNARARETAATKGLPAHDVFPLECIGHQPSLPELKKAHRDRVREKRKDLEGALRFNTSFRATRRRTQKR